MICDKCGCEHNSKSTCPKCGAPVVYVNEDYLRRKKEWEEAQKKGSEPKTSMESVLRREATISTEDGTRENNKSNDRKGRSEMASLSFAEEMAALGEKIGNFFKGKRRKSD